MANISELRNPLRKIIDQEMPVDLPDANKFKSFLTRHFDFAISDREGKYIALHLGGGELRPDGKEVIHPFGEAHIPYARRVAEEFNKEVIKQLRGETSPAAETIKLRAQRSMQNMQRAEALLLRSRHLEHLGGGKPLPFKADISSPTRQRFLREVMVCSSISINSSETENPSTTAT